MLVKMSNKSIEAGKLLALPTLLRGPLLTSCLLAFAFMAGACAGDETEEEGISADPCAVQSLPLQSRVRFPLGATLYLPATPDAEQCGSITWSMSSAPAANANVLVDGDDRFARFTPHTEGEYVFAGTHSETAESFQETFTVVSSVGKAFHNYSYYP